MQYFGIFAGSSIGAGYITDYIYQTLKSIYELFYYICLMCVGLFSYSSSGVLINLLVCLSWILFSYGLISVKLPCISSLLSSHTLSFLSIFADSDAVSSTPFLPSIFLSYLLSIYLSLLSFPLSISAIFPSLYLSLLSFLPFIFLC